MGDSLTDGFLNVRACTVCEEHGKEAIATHTYYDPRNTMVWTCDEHAEEILEDAHTDPQNWIGSKLVPTVEETSQERKERHARQNLLRFPLRCVA